MTQIPDAGAPYMPTPDEIAKKAAEIKARNLARKRESFFRQAERSGKPHTATVRVVRPGKIGRD